MMKEGETRTKGKGERGGKTKGHEISRRTFRIEESGNFGLGRVGRPVRTVRCNKDQDCGTAASTTDMWIPYYRIAKRVSRVVMTTSSKPNQCLFSSHCNHSSCSPKFIAFP